MSEEYFDIVDENNQLTGEKKLRSEVHSEGDWHRTVHVYFYRQVDNEIEILVHLRSKDKDLDPNKWDTRFGGHLKSGESISDAVINEIKEELGHNLEPQNLIDGETRKKENFPNNEFSTEYFYCYNGGLDALSFTDDEVQEVKWMLVSDIVTEMSEKPEVWTSSPEALKRTIESLKSLI